MLQASSDRHQALQRRLAFRQSCFRTCQIVFGPKSFTLAALISDESYAGSRLRLSFPVPLPESFYVIGRDGSCQQAETVWRCGNDLGVRFLCHINLQDQTDATVRLLRWLSVEMAPRNLGPDPRG